MVVEVRFRIANRAKMALYSRRHLSPGHAIDIYDCIHWDLLQNLKCFENYLSHYSKSLLDSRMEKKIHIVQLDT